MNASHRVDFTRPPPCCTSCRPQSTIPTCVPPNQEERQALLLERIIKNVDLLNDALQELNRSVASINNRNQDTTIVAEMWNGYRRNVDFNLQNIDESVEPGIAGVRR